MTSAPTRTPSLTLPLVEAFGPTLQGEGPAAGRCAWFIRTGGCNLSCSWCDSGYTWDGRSYDLHAEITRTDPETIAADIPGGSLVILTGGEPLLHQHTPGFTHLLTLLTGKGCEVHVETNGTRALTEHTQVHTAMQMVSPKLPNAGAHRGNQDPTMHPSWTEHAHRGTACLKVVCRNREDVQKTLSLAEAHDWPRRQVWVMPEGTDPATLARRFPTIAHTAAAAGINATHRLHVLAWGDERGH